VRLVLGFNTVFKSLNIFTDYLTKSKWLFLSWTLKYLAMPQVYIRTYGYTGVINCLWIPHICFYEQCNHFVQVLLISKRYIFHIHREDVWTQQTNTLLTWRQRQWRYMLSRYAVQNITRNVLQQSGMSIVNTKVHKRRKSSQILVHTHYHK